MRRRNVVAPSRVGALWFRLRPAVRREIAARWLTFGHRCE